MEWWAYSGKVIPSEFSVVNSEHWTSARGPRSCRARQLAACRRPCTVRSGAADHLPHALDRRTAAVSLLGTRVNGQCRLHIGVSIADEGSTAWTRIGWRSRIAMRWLDVASPHTPRYGRGWSLVR